MVLHVLENLFAKPFTIVSFTIVFELLLLVVIIIIIK